MNGRWIAKRVSIGIAFFVIAVAIAALFGLAVLHLWNWLMPALFGLHTITYLQAWGLLILSWILFRGPRGWGRPGMFRHRHMRDRWERMTPEEREKFRARMRASCGNVASGQAEAKS